METFAIRLFITNDRALMSLYKDFPLGVVIHFAKLTCRVRRRCRLVVRHGSHHLRRSAAAAAATGRRSVTTPPPPATTDTTDHHTRHARISSLSFAALSADVTHCLTAPARTHTLKTFTRHTAQ